MAITLPQSYLAMPRWWHGDQEWLDRLPETIHEVLDDWQLTVDGSPMHGSNALVLPVRREEEPLALRFTPPDDDTRMELRALRFWNGRGVVRLFDADPVRGISLLERLYGDDTLESRSLTEAIAVLAGMIRRLAIPAPLDVLSTAEIARTRIAAMPGEWVRLGKPFPLDIVDRARDDGEQLTVPRGDLAVNGDLHSAQVLRADREPWLVVDPLLLRGDPAYDMARILWTRLDEMPTVRAIRYWRDLLIDGSGLESNRAQQWIRFRTVDYWLWGLSYGLTEDPVRCERLWDALQ